ncbi:hypothetical protein SLS62_009726 [Diatrype stigma]|uniref:Acyl-coenzyme A diphosphatase SCS3 n=1 Tax=Diatrype stigma TaxID=117547 RepID=A0AAN9UDG8_9PEZI
MSDDAYAVRSRPGKMAGSSSSSGSNGYSPSSPSFSYSPGAGTGTGTRASSRNPPHLPTPSERLALVLYPALLAFGTLFSLVSPETRAAPYDAARHAHVQHGPDVPSYFARKDNLFNVLFVKRGWAWITVAFVAFVLSHPSFTTTTASSVSSSSKTKTLGWRKTLRAAARWALVTAWWLLVTQWCFGPPLIDRGFRITGGRCEVALDSVASSSSSDGGRALTGQAHAKDVFTAAACRAAGGRWSGGHDISGHVFLLVLGSFFLLQEVGWVALRGGGIAAALLQGGGGGGGGGNVSNSGHEERCVVMPDGAVKGAGVEAEVEADDIRLREAGEHGDGENDAAADALGLGGKFAMAVVALCLWMLLMTAIYFHTWFEKLTGLLTAAVGIYAVYYVPRFVPNVRAIVGLPGI